MIFLPCLLVFSLFSSLRANDEIESITNESWRFSVGLGLNIGGKFESDLVFRDSSSGSQVAKGKVDFDIDPAVSLDISAQYMPQNSWGFIGGFTYDSERETTGGEIIINGQRVIIAEDGDNDKIQARVFHASAVYRWESLYLPFGLNYAAYTFKSSDVPTSISGGLGAQLGLGYVVNDNFSIEGMIRATSFELSYTDTDENLDVTFEDGFFSSFLIMGKYIF